MYISTLMSLMKYYWWQLWPTLRTPSARSNHRRPEVCTQSFLQIEIEEQMCFLARSCVFRKLENTLRFFSTFNYKLNHYLQHINGIFLFCLSFISSLLNLQRLLSSHGVQIKRAPFA